jgi:preprotein translocase subunit SecE
MDAIINFFKRIWLTLKNFIEFLKDVRGELKKVTWPSKQEVINSTIVVIVCTLIIGIFLWLCDFAFSKILSLIIG